MKSFRKNLQEAIVRKPVQKEIQPQREDRIKKLKIVNKKNSLISVSEDGDLLNDVEEIKVKEIEPCLSSKLLYDKREHSRSIS